MSDESVNVPDKSSGLRDDPLTKSIEDSQDSQSLEEYVVEQ